MANYATLKAAIQAAIKQNGNKEITGALLQQSLLSMINSLGAGYQFMGVAVLTPTATNPGTPDANVFYIAGQPGIYSNFNNLVVSENEIAVFKYNGNWTKEITGAASASTVSEIVHTLWTIPITKTENPGVYASVWVNNNGKVVATASSAGMSRAEKISVFEGFGVKLTTDRNSSYGTPAAFFCDDEENIIETIPGSGSSVSYDGVAPIGAKFIYVNYLSSYTITCNAIIDGIFELILKTEQDSVDILELKSFSFGANYDSQDKTRLSRWINNNGKIGIDSSGIFSRYERIKIYPTQSFEFNAGPSGSGPLLFIADNDDNIIYTSNQSSGIVVAPENSAFVYVNSQPSYFRFSTYGIVDGIKSDYDTKIGKIYEYLAVGPGPQQSLELTESMFEQGNIDGSTGAEISATNVIRSKEKIRVLPGSLLTYHTINNYRVAFACYDVNGFVVKNEWYSGDGVYTIPDVLYIRFVITNPSGGTGTPTLALSGFTASINPGTVYVPAMAEKAITRIPIYAPNPQLPANSSENSDFNAETLTPDELFGAFNNLLSSIPKPGNAFDKPKFAVVSSLVGRDASNTFDIFAYQFCKRDRFAWKAANGLFAWANGSTIVYTDSVSPRIGDTIYSSVTRTNSGYVVTSFNGSNQQITGSNSVAYTRSNANNVGNDVYWTMAAQRVSPQNLTFYDRSDVSVGTATVIDVTHFSFNGKTYERCEDLDYNSQQEMTIVLWGNEHGPQSDPAEPAIILYRFAKDLVGGCRNNKFITYLKNYCNIILIPCANPYGLKNHTRNNANNVNINRNYCTPGWASQSDSDKGSYAGDQPETQFVMNTVMYFGADLGIDVHCLGYVTQNNVGKVHYEGFIPNANMNQRVYDCMFSLSFEYSNYGGATPSTDARGGDWLYYIGKSGGLIEMNAGDFAPDGGNGKQHTAFIMEMDYTLLLNTLRMWMYGVKPLLKLSDIDIV